MDNLFDNLAKRYDAWFERHRVIYEAELEAVRSMLPGFNRAVEVGVGTGRFAAPLGIGLGVEPSAAMAREAEMREIRVIRGYAENLPLSSCSFDLVLLVTTICFVNDAEQSLREAYRILRPGGHVILGFVDKNSRLGQMYNAKKSESPFYKDAHFFSEVELLRLLALSGFRDEEMKRIRLFAYDTSSDEVDALQQDGDFTVLSCIRHS